MLINDVLLDFQHLIRLLSISINLLSPLTYPILSGKLSEFANPSFQRSCDICDLNKFNFVVSWRDDESSSCFWAYADVVKMQIIVILFNGFTQKSDIDFDRSQPTSIYEHTRRRCLKLINFKIASARTGQGKHSWAHYISYLHLLIDWKQFITSFSHLGRLWACRKCFLALNLRSLLYASRRRRAASRI